MKKTSTTNERGKITVTETVIAPKYSEGDIVYYWTAKGIQKNKVISSHYTGMRSSAEHGCIWDYRLANDIYFFENRLFTNLKDLAEHESSSPPLSFEIPYRFDVVKINGWYNGIYIPETTLEGKGITPKLDESRISDRGYLKIMLKDILDELVADIRKELEEK